MIISNKPSSFKLPPLTYIPRYVNRRRVHVIKAPFLFLLSQVTLNAKLSKKFKYAIIYNMPHTGLPVLILAILFVRTTFAGPLGRLPGTLANPRLLRT